MKKTDLLRWTLGFSAVAALACMAAVAWAKPNTNVTIESDGTDMLTDAERVKRERFGIPIDAETIAGFNEDGDPAVFRRF